MRWLDFTASRPPPRESFLRDRTSRLANRCMTRYPYIHQHESPRQWAQCVLPAKISPSLLGENLPRERYWPLLFRHHLQITISYFNPHLNSCLDRNNSQNLISSIRRLVSLYASQASTGGVNRRSARSGDAGNRFIVTQPNHGTTHRWDMTACAWEIWEEMLHISY
jgi:hypothetical protein